MVYHLKSSDRLKQEIKCMIFIDFHRILYTVEKEREIYDNNQSVIAGLVCIIGFTLALVFMPPLKVAILLWGLCCIIDDIGWIIVYNKNKNALKNIE